MLSFSGYNPIVVFIYFLSVAGIAMFCDNPLISLLSLSGAVLFFLIRNKSRGARSHLFFLLMFIIAALVNPLFYHNGITVLFFINDNPVTLEALIYGVISSAMIISVIYWFRSFSQLLQSDKLLYIFGSVSPKLALILSMTLRYIPLFGAQIKKTNQAQKALGLYKDDNAIDAIKGGVRVFSVTVTWALENGITTADSMEARGYGVGRRSFFSLYKFRKYDATILCIILILSTAVIFGIATDAINFAFYPSIDKITFTPLSVISYLSYGILSFLPSLTETGDNIKWKYLKSKI